MAKIIDLVTNAGQVDVTQGIVEEAAKAVPEMDFFDAGTIKGTTLSTLARTSLPTVAFRLRQAPRGARVALRPHRSL